MRGVRRERIAEFQDDAVNAAATRYADAMRECVRQQQRKAAPEEQEEAPADDESPESSE
jgi:hypothetical protein